MATPKILLISIVSVILIGCLIFVNIAENKTLPSVDSLISRQLPERKKYQRIVSLAPSITEMLFAVGLGNRVVGVTRYCNYPSETQSKSNIGGYYNPNYEAIIDSNPDLVVVLPEHEDAIEYLQKLNMPILPVSNKTTSDIINSIKTIGTICLVDNHAQQVASDIEKKIDVIKEKTITLKPRRTMIAIGRLMGSGSIQNVSIAGKGTFYDEMIQMAGGVNAYKGSLGYPSMSQEGIIRINPDIIIDMVPDLLRHNLSVADVRREWSVLGEVRALMNNQIHVFDEDYVVIPGPRFIHILEKMACVIHPEIRWDN